MVGCSVSFAFILVLRCMDRVPLARAVITLVQRVDSLHVLVADGKVVHRRVFKDSFRTR